MLKKKRVEKQKVNRFIYWTPRILCILFLLFLSIFSWDVFDSCNNFLSCAGGLFMHNIPVFILLAVLIISWKYEIVGAVVFILAGLLYILMIVIGSLDAPNFEPYMISYSFIIAGPAFLIGILFWMNWIKKKK
jgi:ABC-type cobalamin transport system permease subunit